MPPATTTPARRSLPWWRCGLPAFSSFDSDSDRLCFKKKGKNVNELLVLCSFIYVGQLFESVTDVRIEIEIGCGFLVTA